jgi:hypothetical protein
MEQESQTPEATLQAEQAEERYKTLGVRLGEELHAQLSFIAQLKGSTITEEIRQSIEARVLAAQDDPDLIARAEAVRGQIEREAEARRQAIAGFFGKAAVEGEDSDAAPARSSRRRGATSNDK